MKICLRINDVTRIHIVFTVMYFNMMIQWLETIPPIQTPMQTKWICKLQYKLIYFVLLSPAGKKREKEKKYQASVWVSIFIIRVARLHSQFNGKCESERNTQHTNWKLKNLYSILSKHSTSNCAQFDAM